MKRIQRSIIAVLLITLIFGVQYEPQATISKVIKSQEIYQEVIGFSKTDKIRKPIEKNIMLFKNKQEWNKFANEFLSELPIPNINFNGKYVILVKIDWKGKNYTTGSTFAISNISLSGKNLIVSVKDLNIMTEVSPVNAGYKFSYVIITTIDKKGIPDDVKVNRNVIE